MCKDLELNDPTDVAFHAISMALASATKQGKITREDGERVLEQANDIIDALFDGKVVTFLAETGTVVISERGVLADHEAETFPTFVPASGSTTQQVDG